MDLDIQKKESDIQTHENDITINSLLQSAVKNNLPVETMEKLLEMRTKLKEEWSREQYYKALSQFQAACPAIRKNKIIMDKSGNIKYKYADLSSIVLQIKDKLQEFGFSYMIHTKQDNNQITAICISNHVDGWKEESSVTVPISGDYMNNIQQVGNAMTYAKRYAFCNMYGIMTADEDQDANQQYEAVKGNQKNFKNANNENQSMFHEIMKLVNSYHKKVQLFKNNERKNYFENASAIIGNKTELENMFIVLKEIAMNRIAEMEKGEK